MKVIFTKTIENNYYRFYKDNKEFFMLACPCQQIENGLAINACQGIIFACDHIPQTRHKAFVDEVKKTFEDMEDGFRITKYYHNQGLAYEALIKELLNVLFYYARHNIYKK